jgi:hypothetical protein
VLDIFRKVPLLIPVEGVASQYSAAVEDEYIILNTYQPQKGILTPGRE